MGGVQKVLQNRLSVCILNVGHVIESVIENLKNFPYSEGLVSDVPVVNRREKGESGASDLLPSDFAP